MRKVFILLVGLIGVLLFSSISIAAADTPPSVTVNSCSTTGLLVSASGTADDDNGMTSIYIYVDGIFVGGVDQYPPFGPHVSWTINNAAVPYGHQNKCIAITARATDTIGQTGTSGSCYAGIPERCEDGLENDCDGKTDCADSECEGQWCKTEGIIILPNWKCCSGACVDTDTDPNNCGSCGNACGANAYCSSGTCQCNSGYGNCDGDWSNGCEVNLNTDPNNCGSCGNACGANAYCSSGTCQCNSGYGNCDGDWSNGCEVNLNTDPNNCGSCGNACGANAYCSGGTCHCKEGYGNCDGDWSNGCEVNTNTDRNNCGECGNACDEDYWGCYDDTTRAKYHCSCVEGSFYWEVIETDPCPEGEVCVDGVCEEEVPEFPAGVTAVFGATFFIFLMMRRKYIEK